MFNFDTYTEIKDKIKSSKQNTKIIAISKNQPQEYIDHAISHGVLIFGENRVQEAFTKFEKLKKKNNKIELHLTGPLQTNKVKQAIKLFDVFHTLDREKLLREFCKFPDEVKNKKFFIQVNTGKEKTKSGIYPEEVEKFLTMCLSYKFLKIEGLMCIPPINENPKIHFELLQKISKDFGINGLSIGMSSDYLTALSFNPLYIRLGTILFGKRK